MIHHLPNTHSLIGPVLGTIDSVDSHIRSTIPTPTTRYLDRFQPVTPFSRSAHGNTIARAKYIEFPAFPVGALIEDTVPGIYCHKSIAMFEPMDRVNVNALY